jgi:hypothetical protein
VVGLIGAGLASAEAAPGVLANVKPLKSLMFWSEGPDGDTFTFEAFLQID